MFNLSPLFLVAAADEYRLGPREQGILMSLEIAGIALASFLVLFLIDRIGPRRLAAFGAGVILAGNLLTLVAPHFAWLALLRLFIGFAGDGLAYASAIVLLGRHMDPMRAFGVFAFSNMCFTGAMLAVLPRLSGEASWQTLLYLFAFLGLLALISVRQFPDAEQRPPSLLVRGYSMKASVALAGIFAFTANLGAVWGNAANLGTVAGLSADRLGLFLSLSILFQALGSLTAALSSQWRYRKPLPMVFLALHLLSLYMLHQNPSQLLFAVAIALWGYSWNFGIVAMLGLLARQPGGERFMALAPGTEALGAASGPMAVGLLVQWMPLADAVSATALVGTGCAALVYGLLQTPGRNRRRGDSSSRPELSN